MENQLPELPRWRCHKIVQAVKIKEITVCAAGGAVIVPEGVDIPVFAVSAEYMGKHAPAIGGYFVVYEDGYRSWSPAKAFEEGYSRI
jgi:hypothetical protein